MWGSRLHEEIQIFKNHLGFRVAKKSWKKKGSIPFRGTQNSEEIKIFDFIHFVFPQNQLHRFCVSTKST